MKNEITFGEPFGVASSLRFGCASHDPELRSSQRQREGVEALPYPKTSQDDAFQTQLEDAMIAHIRFTKFLAVTVWMLLFSTIALAQYQQNQLRYPGDSLGLTVRGGSCLFWNWEGDNWESSVSKSQFGDGITYFVWFDRGEYDIRIRGAAIDSMGNLLWERTVNDEIGYQIFPVVQAVQGGCVVAWLKEENDWGGTTSLHAQKMSSAGLPQWPTIGDTAASVQITAESEIHTKLRLLSDGSSGAYCFWSGFEPTMGIDLFGTRILGNGQVAPGFPQNGRTICTATGNQPSDDDYSITSDTQGGVWVSWSDSRRANNTDLYLQHLHADGTIQFDLTGRPLILTAENQRKVQLTPDGCGGAFVVWQNSTLDNQSIKIYMQRIDSLGNPQWTPDTAGVALNRITYNQTNPKIAYSAVDTCIVSWDDYRDSGINIFINKVTGSNGITRLWGENGSAVFLNHQSQWNSILESDGSGGAVLVWIDGRDLNTLVYSQRVNSNGIVMWDGNGRPIANHTNRQMSATVLRVNRNFLYLWQDTRDGSEPIYRTMWDGSGNPVNGFPSGGTLTIRDIDNSCYSVSVLSNEPDRFFTAWVDERKQPFGNRVYYSVNNSVTGEPIGCARDGNPITIDSSYHTSQSSGYSMKSLLTIPSTDFSSIVVYEQVVGEEEFLYGQKISRNGERMWGDFGSRISSSTSCPDNFAGVPDGSGGAFICYHASDQHQPFGYNQVYLQRINSLGAPQLNPAGVAIGAAGSERSVPSMIKSGENYYVGYIELNDEINMLCEVVVAKIDLSGQVIWSRIVADSIVYTVSYPSLIQPNLLPEPNGGVAIFWKQLTDNSNDSTRYYAQCLDSLGHSLWNLDRLPLSGGISSYSTYDVVRSGDHYWFAWNSEIGGSQNHVFLQRISYTGTLLCPMGQIAYQSADWQSNVILASGRNGSVYLFWKQNISSAPPLWYDRLLTYGMHYDESAGRADSLTWSGADGAGIVSAFDGIVSTAVTDSWGGAIVGINRFRWHFEENLVVSVQRIYDRTCVDVKEVVSEALPGVYLLEQNYPNPFNGETKFRFTLPVSGVVKVTIFDVMGREVVTPVHRQFQAGTFDVHWNGKSNTGVKVSSGVYFYRIEAGKYVSTKKMVMVQ